MTDQARNQQPWQVNAASDLAKLSGDDLVAKKREWVKDIERQKVLAEAERRDMVSQGYRLDEEGRWEPSLHTPRRLKASMFDREQMFQAQNGLCGICQVALFHINICHVDHIVPLSLGGADHPQNMHLVHASCNLAKGATMAPNED